MYTSSISSDLYSILGISSSTNSSTTTSISTTDFSDMLLSALTSATSTYADSSVSSASASTRQAPPDFDSMSLDEFRSHIEELQAKADEYGVDTHLPDISNMTDDELSALKDDMANKRPPHGKPPVGIESLMSDYSESTEIEDLSSILIQAIEDIQEYMEENENLFSTYMSNSLAYEQLIAQYSINI